MLLIRVTGQDVPRDSAALAVAVAEVQLALERLGFGDVSVTATHSRDLKDQMTNEFLAELTAPPERTSG